MSHKMISLRYQNGPRNLSAIQLMLHRSDVTFLRMQQPLMKSYVCRKFFSSLWFTSLNLPHWWPVSHLPHSDYDSPRLDLDLLDYITGYQTEGEMKHVCWKGMKPQYEICRKLEFKHFAGHFFQGIQTPNVAPVVAMTPKPINKYGLCLHRNVKLLPWYNTCRLFSSIWCKLLTSGKPPPFLHQLWELHFVALWREKTSTNNPNY